MVKITFVQAEGKQSDVFADAKTTLLTAALNNGVEGIIGECGGNLSCATCHVFIEEPWIALLPPKSPDEEVMLEGAAEEPLPTSRLACQVCVSPEVDGIVVRIPQSQR